MDPVAVLTTAITTLGDTIEGVAAPALVLGGGVVALTFGWRLVKKFAKG